MLQFKNFKELLVWLSDEKITRQHMEQMRWGDAPFCPIVEPQSRINWKKKKTYRCKEKACKKDFTVTVGTVFENSKVKLSAWMAAIYLLTAHKKGISSLQLSRDYNSKLIFM